MRHQSGADARAQTHADDRARRRARIVASVRSIPEGFVRTYGDIDAAAPRLVGQVLSATHDLPWQRVVRADGSIPQGYRQRELLMKEGVPMRGDRVDLRRARLPAELT
ncbi:MAG TPA: MGMT family protein [Solirubrobacteraceae bacterium]|jgi:methylated-DNA-protein-cysteine methyltransferase-like protein|nr:MGMT family protein [Solirubrobacteraceae bacterium]